MVVTVRPGHIADLLSNLCDLSVHYPRMCSHNIELGGQLIDGLTEGFTSFFLGLNETLHKILQIKL